MPVLTNSSTSVTLPLGANWVISGEVRDADDYESATLPTVTVTLPGGTTASPVATSVSPSGFRVVYPVASLGRYVARVTGGSNGVADFTAYVTALTAAAQMPTLADLDDYLGENGASWSDAEMQNALDVESSAQRDACRVPADYPMSMRHALLRRCARNLAFRALPLAVQRGDSESGDSTFLPGRDPEVRRLEGPYRKLVFG